MIGPIFPMWKDKDSLSAGSSGSPGLLGKMLDDQHHAWLRQNGVNDGKRRPVFFHPTHSGLRSASRDAAYRNSLIIALVLADGTRSATWRTGTNVGRRVANVGHSWPRH